MANSTNKIENIQLYVRVRPINAREREVVQVPSPKEVVVTQVLESKILKKFTFDRAFGPDSRQADVYYTVVAPLVEEVLSGYNCTVFAYGQTGTGKTHTMIGTEGPELKSSREEDSMVGIIPRAWSHLFDELRTMDVEFSMRISYLELYNEEFCDLLSSEDTKKIRIFDDANKKGSVIIQGLEEIPVHSKDDVYKLLEKGKERRKTAATLMNAQSSRSHTVFTILLHIKESGIDGEEMLKIGKLNLVDLAGSENISKAGNEKGIRTRETFNINQSLLALGRVITALVERTPHVPYRESKLTRLLQESLGGRAKTSIIATVSPGHKDLEETLNTLYYACRAKNIKNRPELNMKLTKKTVLKQYNDKIDQLNRDLMAARGKNGIYLAEETYNDLNCKLDSQNKELNEKMLLVKALKDDLASKERIFNEVSRHFSEKSEQLKRNEKHLTHAISKLEEKKTELQQTTKVLTTIERHYKEKKHLLGTHVETEKHLTNQAIQLIEVVEVATADTHMLHNTIERRKSNDVEIKSACEVFVSKMEKTFDIMNKNLENLQKEHNSLSEIIMEEIGKNSMEHKNFSSVAINKVKSISEKHVESMNDIHRYLQKYGSQFTDGNSEHEREFLQLLNELKQNEMDFKFTFEKHFAELLQLINQQSLIVTNNSSNVAELIVKNHQTVTEFAKSTTSRLNDITKSAKSTLEDDIATIGNCIEARKNISSRRQALLNSFNRDCRSLDQEENVLDEKLQTVSYNARELNNKIDENAGCEIKALQELNANLQDSFIELNSSVLNLKNETHDSIGKRTNRVSRVNEILVKHLNSKGATVLNLEQMTECHSTELIELFDRFKTDTMAKEEAIRVQIDTDCNHVSELINMDTERVKQYETQSRALNESLQSSIKEYTTQYHDNIAECKDQLQNFQSNELKTYTPTGQTPSRNDFSYPRVLVATSPHSNVIRRFRMDREWSDSDTTVTINDDSENPLHDFSADELGISWTPNPKVNDTVKVDANNNGVITLKDLHAEFNCKIPTLLSMIDDQS